MIYPNYKHGVEHYSHIKDIIKSLGTASSNITDELKNTAGIQETIIESINMNLVNVT